MKVVKENLIGTYLENVHIDYFKKHGIPIPIYTEKPHLLLLFKDENDCEKYLKSLSSIKDELESNDPDKKKINIQDTINFITKIISGLNCG